MKRRTLSERFGVKLANYHAAKKKAKARHTYKQRKQKKKAELLAVLAMAHAAMGYKPLGRKLTPEHIKTLHAGRDRYFQAKRKRRTKRFPQTATTMHTVASVTVRLCQASSILV